MAHKGIRHKVQYFVNKEKGIVVARINDCKRDFISFLFDSCNQNALAYRDKEYDQLLMPRSFVGVAQLGENDIGMRNLVSKLPTSARNKSETRVSSSELIC